MFKEFPATQAHLEAARKNKVCGIGTNDAPYYTSIGVDGETRYCPYYTRWKKMLNSCYSTASGSGRKKSVCKEWLSFMGFRRWMERQKWQGNELIHWLRMPGATSYSPATCLFVPKRVRSLFPVPSWRRAGRPLGVREEEGRFIASCRSPGRKRGYVGSFDTLDEAVEAYLIAKEIEVINVANAQKDPLISQAIMDYCHYFCAQQRSLKTI